MKWFGYGLSIPQGSIIIKDLVPSVVPLEIAGTFGRWDPGPTPLSVPSLRCNHSHASAHAHIVVIHAHYWYSHWATTSTDCAMQFGLWTSKTELNKPLLLHKYIVLGILLNWWKTDHINIPVYILDVRKTDLKRFYKLPLPPFALTFKVKFMKYCLIICLYFFI
jgi:hypothetical protein